MPEYRVVITDCDFEMPPTIEEAELRPVGAEVVVANCTTEDDVIAVAADAHGLLVQYAPISARVIERLDRCRAIARYGIGMDVIDIPAAVARGIVCCNVPDYCVSEVADHTMALLLACARWIVTLNESVRHGDWDAIGVAKPCERVAGRTLGLIGLGRTAQAVAVRARAFELDLIGYSPRAPGAVFDACGVARVELDELLERSDFVSLHTPLREETHHLIGSRELALMKPTAFLLNTARGALVDNAALLTALETGMIGGAGLDVLEREPMPADSPLRRAPNLIVTPHIAFYSQTSLRILRRDTAAEIARVLRGEAPRSPVTPE